MEEIKVESKFIRAENIRTDEGIRAYMANEHYGAYAKLDNQDFICIMGTNRPFSEVRASFQRPEEYVEGIYPNCEFLIKTGEVQIIEGMVGVYLYVCTDMEGVSE